MARPIAIVVAVVLGSAGLAGAGVESVAVKVDGLTCPFCAYGLEKHLKKVEGVESVRIDVDGGEAFVEAADDAVLTDVSTRKGLLGAVREAVEKGGFTPREIAVVVEGRLQVGEEPVLLVLDSTGESLRLEAGTGRQLPKGLTREGRVRVRGIAGTDSAGAGAWLQVTEVLAPLAGDGTKEESP